MYALTVGVRNKFVSLSCFSDSPDKAIDKAQEVVDAWTGPYSLDPSWDQDMNGQENSLVWCQDGAKVLTPEHFQDGFFMILVKESKDSELKLWKPYPGSTRIVCAELRKFGYGNGLRLVKPFGDQLTSSQNRRLLKAANTVAFSEQHLKRWCEELVATDGGYTQGTFGWPETHLLPRRLHVSATH